MFQSLNFRLKPFYFYHHHFSLVLLILQYTFYLNDKLADLNEVKNAIFSLDKKTIVELKSDKNAKFESFVKIIDFLKAKEHENFQIITEKNK